MVCIGKLFCLACRTAQLEPDMGSCRQHLNVDHWHPVYEIDGKTKVDWNTVIIGAGEETFDDYEDVL